MPGSEPVYPEPREHNSASQWQQQRHITHRAQQPEAGEFQQQQSPTRALRDDSPGQAPVQSSLNASPHASLKTQDEMVNMPFASVGGPSLATNATHLADFGQHVSGGPKPLDASLGWPKRLDSELNAEKRSATAHGAPMDRHDNQLLQPSTPKVGPKVRPMKKMLTSRLFPSMTGKGSPGKKRYAAM